MNNKTVTTDLIKLLIGIAVVVTVAVFAIGSIVASVSAQPSNLTLSGGASNNTILLNCANGKSLTVTDLNKGQTCSNTSPIPAPAASNNTTVTPTPTPAVTKPPAIAQTIPSIPIEINPYTQGVAFSHLMFYLNATDNHVHFKGLVQNTLPVSVDSLSISLSFEDKATSTSVHSASWLTPFGSPMINSKQTVAFDMDTGYNKAQLNQFQYLKAMIT